MSTEYPVTLAVRFLRANKVEFTPHLYAYEEKGGTARSSSELGVAEHVVVKTLVMEDQDRKPLIILMHGDCEVSTKELARQLGAKAISPCKPDVASKHTGYLVGGTSPFGTTKKLPIYAEKTIADLDTIYINGGQRGFLVSLKTSELLRVLSPQLVSVKRSASPQA